MKDLCGEIRNTCMSLALVIRHLPDGSPDKILLKASTKRLEDTLLRCQVKLGKLAEILSMLLDIENEDTGTDKT
jgi:hypothetical protein